MTIGFVMIAHGRLKRAAQVAATLAAQGAPVIVHVDGRTGTSGLRNLCNALQTSSVEILPGAACRMGHWSMVKAILRAGQQLIASHPGITHVCLISGDAVPLKQVQDMQSYLATRPDTDMIESVSLDLADWVGNGLGKERLTLFHPAGLGANSKVFDLNVALQRRLGIKRRPPNGMRLYLGSQWWCLTRRTFSLIAAEAKTRSISRFFRYSWIPDESFFQTLVRRHARLLESQSPMLAEFDAEDRVRMIYDDHIDALETSDKFFARTVWHGANAVYARFAPAGHLPVTQRNAPDPSLQEGEPLHRLPSPFVTSQPMAETSAREYWAFMGLDCMFEGFAERACKDAGLHVHGRLFARQGAQFAAGVGILPGGVSADPAPRDAAPLAFLRNVVRASRGTPCGFSIHPSDTLGIAEIIASDPKARIVVVPGAWVFEKRWAADAAAEVARFSHLQRRETALLNALAPAQRDGRATMYALSDVLLEPTRILTDMFGETAMVSTASLPARIASDLPQKLRELTDLRDLGLTPTALPEIEKASALVYRAADAMRRRAG